MKDNGESFLSTVSGYLVSLPYDLKVIFEAMSEENLDRPARELATGTIIHVLTPKDAAPPNQPHLAYVGEAILLRIALREIARIGGEGSADFRGRFPEEYGKLEQDLATFKGYLGDCFHWLERQIERLPRAVYRNKKVSIYLDDEEASEFLYEESLAFSTEYELDEETVGRVKRPEPIKRYLERRMSEDAKRIS